MDAASKEDPVLDSLDPLPDEDLRRVIERARGLLAARANERRKQELARENDRRKQALVQIKRIAKEAGLDIAVKHPARKRGRPRKTAAPLP